MANTVYKSFIEAALNSRWDDATEHYEDLHDSQYPFASDIFELLVRQHKNAELAEVVDRYRSLDINKPNRKTQTPLIVAFHVANTEAVMILRRGGANPLAVDGHSKTIQDYADFSTCRRTMDMAETMLAQARKPRETESVKQLLLAKRMQKKVEKYQPDF